ncbi:MAG: AAA family ATPase [Clostridia bacterium]
MNNIKVYAFVGPSGTGKSYRAQMVANENNIHYIIDDGLFINDNEIIAGESAKKAPTKIETVKKALFLQQEQKDEIRKAIEKYKPESILILGTSDGMVNKIAANIGLPPVEKIIYIEEIATPEEIQEARRSRVTEGKHVIPVPTFEIKKDFSGFILDPLQIFKIKSGNNKPYISEKSIIRPTFSYLGNFTISDTVFRQIIEYVAQKEPNIHNVLRTRIDNQPEGPYVYIELSVEYGENVRTIVENFKNKIIKELEKLTTMRVQTIKIVIKEIHINKE